MTQVVRNRGVLPLVLHHDYRRGDATDLSGRGNHGIVVDADVDPSTGRDGLALDGRTSRVIVPPAESMARTTRLRVTVTARLDELRERSNLVEGYLSFALLVHGDGSIQGGTYDGSRWLSVRSGSSLVRRRVWNEITLVCQPWFASSLYVNGVLTAWDRRRQAEINPIDWPFGTNVGAWPDADAFMLKGNIRELYVWMEGAGLDGHDVLDHDPDDPARPPEKPR